MGVSRINTKSSGPNVWQQNKQLNTDLATQKALATKNAGLLAEQKKLRAAEINRGRGYIGQEQSKWERQAGVTAPGFEGMRDRKTGKLLSEFAFDPYKSQMTKGLREEALATGPSKWAQSALEQQQYQQAQGLGQAGLEQQKAQSAAQAQLMRQGGLGGGARTSLARSGARDALMASQGVRAQGAERRFDITDADLRRKQDLTGTLADVERQGQLQNIGMTEKDVGRRSEFDKTRYTEQMKAWAAGEQAKAQNQAAARSGGGCFPEWTEVKMRDGSFKIITDIKPGDVLFLGGSVIDVHVYESSEDIFNIFDYNGVDVTGSHAVLEYGAWVRVEDSKKAIKTSKSVNRVVNLSTTLHQLLIGDQVFADHMETDEDIQDFKESLAALNGATV